MACQTNFFLRIEMGPTIFENWVMETKNWVMRIDEPNGPLEFKSSLPCCNYQNIGKKKKKKKTLKFHGSITSIQSTLYMEERCVKPFLIYKLFKLHDIFLPPTNQ